MCARRERSEGGEPRATGSRRALSFAVEEKYAEGGGADQSGNDWCGERVHGGALGADHCWHPGYVPFVPSEYATAERVERELLGAWRPYYSARSIWTL
jgi:hypothetical protein